MFLTSTSHLIRVVTTAAASVTVTADWLDIVTATSVITPGHTTTVITTAATVTVVAAPSAGTIRRVIGMTVVNTHAVTTNTATVETYDGTNAGRPFSDALLPSESAKFAEATGWDRYSAAGKRQTAGVDGAAGSDGVSGLVRGLVYAESSGFDLT